MRSVLRSLVHLQRDDDPEFQYPNQIFLRDVFEALTSRGSVYHRSGGPPVARLRGCNMAPNRGWDVLYFTAPEQSEGSGEGQIDTGSAYWECFPRKDDDVLRRGFTQLHLSVSQHAFTLTTPSSVSSCHFWANPKGGSHASTIKLIVVIFSMLSSTSAHRFPTLVALG
jgi:hypothetical protein